MDIGAILAQAGVAGVGLYLFATGRLLPKSVSDDLVAKLSAIYESRIKDLLERLAEMRRDRDEWRRLALGSERRLDVAAPTVATALGAPVPSLPPAPVEDGA